MRARLLQKLVTGNPSIGKKLHDLQFLKIKF